MAGSPREDGYRLWLQYDAIANAERLAQYRAAFSVIVAPGASPSPTLIAAVAELSRGLTGLLDLGDGAITDEAVGEPGRDRVTTPGAIVVGTPTSSAIVASLALRDRLGPLGTDGFLVERAAVDGNECTVIAANHDIGVLYGVFHLLRHLQAQRPVDSITTSSAPKLRYRMLDHWDNLDRTVERGYAGFSLWDWHKLPDHIDPRYVDYARANASIGINATVLTNVNANALVLTAPWLQKVAALAAVFRPYGIRVFLTARFSAPIEIGGLTNADPADANVARFWRDKATEIYQLIPDFGGFVVKANSEGQPGPHDYGRTHADGANLLADALAPHGGVVFWRAFVYTDDGASDRHAQAYDEIVPLDGKFRDNVLLQVKNGAIDFQPREPFHPLFGAMAKTPLVAEFQITQEYLGFATHLVYLGTLFAETLNADTGVEGAGGAGADSHARGGRTLPTVAKVLDGSVHRGAATGMAGVTNIGNDRNWCGHPFAQANWFAFGRLAWDPELSAETIADEWIRMTFSTDPRFVEPVRQMMLASREACVDYMTPLGLHHLMGWDHHYGPAPWISEGRADWTSVYFHRADRAGIGFDRSSTGSNAVAQYTPAVRDKFAHVETCPENLLLWFHHVRWDHVMQSGRTLWDELCHRYHAGVTAVRAMRKTWAAVGEVEGLVDRARHAHVTSLLAIQEKEAIWWRDACLLYFQTFSQRPFPPGSEPPSATLDDFKKIAHRYVPGSRV